MRNSQEKISISDFESNLSKLSLVLRIKHSKQKKIKIQDVGFPTSPKLIRSHFLTLVSR